MTDPNFTSGVNDGPGNPLIPNGADEAPNKSKGIPAPCSAGVATTISLPWPSPPLSLNDRLHWAAKSRLIRTVRDVTCAFAKQARIPQQDQHVTVTLHYRQRVTRRADKDNLMATLKPAIDGLRDAGVLVEDDSTRVTPLVEIHPAVTGEPGALWLEIA